MAGKIIHGVNAVTEALASGRVVNRVYLARESRAPGADRIPQLAKEARVPFDFVPQAKLNELAGTREHQGVAAAISPVAYAELGPLLESLPPAAILLALDQVQHPKNLGMILRTAAAAGAAAVLAPTRGGALLDEEVVRASAGMVMRVPVVACPNLAQTLRTLRDADFWIYALAADGEQSVFEMNWPARTVLVAGNESSGVRHGVRKACDGALRIPLADGVESLNVAVACGVALFQAAEALRRA